jgi:hypothetical protein
VNVRTAEAQRAAALLGAKLEFGNLQDAHITGGRDDRNNRGGDP